MSGLMPLLFIVLWSTGFIGAKLGAPYAEPFTFLGLRFAIAAAILLLIARLWNAPWPSSRLCGHIVIAGLLIHGIHLAGVFYAIDSGLPAGIAALFMGLQPLLTATVAGRLLGERVGRYEWLGLGLGLIGITLVLQNRFGGEISGSNIVIMAFSVSALTIGTLYQKRFCSQMDLRTGGVIQYSVSASALITLAYLTETMEIAWTGEFIFALAWLVLVLSVGAVALLLTMIRRGAAYRVASVFYLSPPFAALFAYALFGEALSVIALSGMVIAMFGVILVTRAAR